VTEKEMAGKLDGDKLDTAGLKGKKETLRIHLALLQHKCAQQYITMSARTLATFTTHR
jgi:hypothetical protein